MEYVNKIEVCGYVGSVNKFNIGDTKAARFSLATAESSKDNEENIIVETTWFNCIAFEGKDKDLSVIEKNSTLKVSGRVRNTRYVDSNGVERISFEIVCNSIKPIDK